MRRLLLPVLLVTLVLAGCSGDDDPEPRIAPSESSSPASTSAPPSSPTGPVEPTMPAEAAAGEDAAAAEAFARYFWETVNYAQATGETSALSQLGDSDCAACSGGIDEVKRVHLAGGSMSGGVIKIRSIASHRISSGPSIGFAVTLTVEVSPQTVKVPGKEVKRYSGGPGVFQMIIERQDAAWTVERWDSK